MVARRLGFAGAADGTNAGAFTVKEDSNARFCAGVTVAKFEYLGPRGRGINLGAADIVST